MGGRKDLVPHTQERHSMATTKKIEFVQTLRVLRAVRIRTSNSVVSMIDPVEGVARSNDIAGKVIDIPPGSLFQVVCTTHKPDQTSGILVVKSGKKVLRAGMVLRKMGWDALQEACADEASLPARAANSAEEMAKKIHARVAPIDRDEDSESHEGAES